MHATPPHVTAACKAVAASMRHNRGMRPLPAFRHVLLPLLLLAAASCGREPVPLPGISGDDGRVEWRGVAPCADCDGIDTRLLLERSGEDRRFLLVETYLADGGGTRFLDRGQWRQSAALLRLEGGDGSLRTYTVLDDGRLRASDWHGDALPGHDDALLTPVMPGNAP